LLRTFNHPRPYAGAQFGYALGSIADLTGDGAAEVLVGAPFDENAPPDVPAGGLAYVLSSADGSLIAELSSPAPSPGGHFGMSLAGTEGFRWCSDCALFGLWVVVGEPHGGPDGTGQAHLFRVDGSGTAMLEDTLARQVDSPDTEFGRSVSIAGFSAPLTEEGGGGDGWNVAVAAAGNVHTYYGAYGPSPPLLYGGHVPATGCTRSTGGATSACGR
jgi:hypothetical protein